MYVWFVLGQSYGDSVPRNIYACGRHRRDRLQPMASGVTRAFGRAAKNRGQHALAHWPRAGEVRGREPPSELPKNTFRTRQRIPKWGKTPADQAAAHVETRSFPTLPFYVTIILKRVPKHESPQYSWFECRVRSFLLELIAMRRSKHGSPVGICMQTVFLFLWTSSVILASMWNEV